MRKTIRRGVLVTATAACALGFGFTQASAATVPALPAVPAVPSLPAVSQLPLGAVPNIGQDLGANLPLPSLDGVNVGQRSLPTGLPVSDVTTGLPVGGLPTGLSPEALPLDQVAKLTPLGSLGRLSELGLGEITTLPGTENLPATLPTSQLTPAAAELPVNVRKSPVPAVPAVPKLPALDGLLDTPLTILPMKDGQLPVEATIEHNDLPSHLVPETNGVSVQGVPTSPLEEVTSVTDSIELPGTPSSTPGMQSISLPRQLPLDLPAATTVPSVSDVTGGGLSSADLTDGTLTKGVKAPVALPALPAALPALPV